MFHDPICLAAFKKQKGRTLLCMSTFNEADIPLVATLQSAARLLGIKFLDHLVLGSADCEDGRAFVSVTESINGQRGGRA